MVAAAIRLVDLFQHDVAFFQHTHIQSTSAIVPARDRAVNIPMPKRLSTKRKSTTDLPTRQTARASGNRWRTAWTLARITIVMVCQIVSQGSANAQIFDSLDSYPPRWHLSQSDCQARVIGQEHLADGGVDGGACESISFVAGHGAEAVLIYPIEPVLALDDLLARVSVMSAKRGAKIGFRVRYPFLRDPETGRPKSVIIYGAQYTTPGEYASIGIGMIERPLKLKNMAMRGEFGSDADLSDAFVDAVAINAYAGPGTTALRMDNLRVDGLVPVAEGVTTGNAHDDEKAFSDRQRMTRLPPDSAASEGFRHQPAFPVGRITKILQYNGEPLAWVRSLGFDAVLLSGPPDATILGEASQARMAIYAPPPSSPDPAIEALLEPVLAWYLGAGESLDSRQIDATARTSALLRSWPSRWQRPIIAAPSESWRNYAPLVDGVVDDLPPRVRGIRGGEEISQMTEARRRIGNRVEMAVGICSMPPESMVRQAESIANAIGAPPPSGFRWHSMWLQTMRSLESTPHAILYRSTRPLSSGATFDNTRAMALSYVNRMISMIAPWVISSTPATAPPLTGAPYRCTRLATDDTDLLILTSVAARGSEVLAGDGDTLEIQLTPADAAKTAWRLTHFSAQRLTLEATSMGSRLQIISPDAAEIIVLSTDPAVGGKLSQSATTFARQASLDRWQLASEAVRRTRENWNRATAARASDRRAPSNLVDVAEQTLMQAEPMYRAGDTEQTLRMAHRADSWTLRSDWQLAESLMPDWPSPTSSPPMDFRRRRDPNGLATVDGRGRLGNKSADDRFARRSGLDGTGTLELWSKNAGDRLQRGASRHTWHLPRLRSGDGSRLTDRRRSVAGRLRGDRGPNSKSVRASLRGYGDPHRCGRPHARIWRTPSRAFGLRFHRRSRNGPIGPRPF